MLRFSLRLRHCSCRGLCLGLGLNGTASLCIVFDLAGVILLVWELFLWDRTHSWDRGHKMATRARRNTCVMMCLKLCST